jgi:hypothetical protein
VGNNRQDPCPLFQLRHDKEDVVHAETGGFRFAALELLEKPCQAGAVSPNDYDQSCGER